MADQKLKAGDDVVLTGRVTRVDDRMVTVKIEGVATPVTLRVDLVRKAPGGAIEGRKTF